MKCPKCRFVNPNDSKFCIECASPMEFHCPNCGAITPVTWKFCKECAFDLRKPQETPLIDFNQPQSYTPKYLADKILTTLSSIEGERKLVTVLFADVADYTAMSEKLDPEEIHQIMDGCFKILMDEIHKYEGTINQFTGDGVMALFGAPVAHEDHVFTIEIGHGPGLFLYEPPIINRLWSQKHPQPFKVGQVIAFESRDGEPGMGARIEDMIVVTENGAELLSRFPRDELIPAGFDWIAFSNHPGNLPLPEARSLMSLSSLRPISGRFICPSIYGSRTRGCYSGMFGSFSLTYNGSFSELNCPNEINVLLPKNKEFQLSQFIQEIFAANAG